MERPDWIGWGELGLGVGTSSWRRWKRTGMKNCGRADQEEAKDWNVKKN